MPKLPLIHNPNLLKLVSPRALSTRSTSGGAATDLTTPRARQRGRQQDPTRPAAASRALGDASAGTATQSPGGAATGPHPPPPRALGDVVVPRRDAAAASSRTRRSQQQPCARSATQAPTPPPVRIGRPQPHPHQQEVLPEASRRSICTNRTRPPGARSAPTGSVRPALDLHHQDPATFVLPP